MRNTFNSKRTALAVACALALGAFSTSAYSQGKSMADINDKQFLSDSQGVVVMTATGDCVHNDSGPIPAWTSGCNAPVERVAQYVAPAPARAPVIVAQAPRAVYEKVAFDANVLFDHDKSTLRPAGRSTLDQFVSNIRGLESQSVLAVGYADRMGTNDYNQALSQRRVDTVKSYLVEQGIASNRVQTSAKGESQPTTALSDCKDAKNATNIACLQPDRHVFIEVSGSRLVN